MTPEVGPQSYGFWPPQSAIDELNKACLLQNLTTAHVLLNYGEAEEIDPEEILTAYDGTLSLMVKKYGLLAGELTLRVNSHGRPVRKTPHRRAQLPNQAKWPI